MSKHTQKSYLTEDQVYELNEKHGWFTFGDAQSDVSKAFAQEAIEMHERMRAAAPDLLQALQRIVLAADNLDTQGGGLVGYSALIDASLFADAVIAKATKG